MQPLRFMRDRHSQLGEHRGSLAKGHKRFEALTLLAAQIHHSIRSRPIVEGRGHR